MVQKEPKRPQNPASKALDSPPQSRPATSVKQIHRPAKKLSPKLAPTRRARAKNRRNKKPPVKIQVAALNAPADSRLKIAKAAAKTAQKSLIFVLIDEFALVNPGHHRAEAFARFFDWVVFEIRALGVHPRVVCLALEDEILGESALLDVL